MRISPACESLLARGLRRGARPPRPQRPAPRIRSRGVARDLARPRLRNLRRVSPQSTGLSCPLSDLTQRLDTEIKFCRDFFRGVVFGLRCAVRVGRPAGAAVVKSCTGDRRVEIYYQVHVSYARHIHVTHRVRRDGV